jgi:hypothetical protein
VKRKIASDSKRDVATHFKVGDRVRLIDGRILDGATRKGVERTSGPYWIREVLQQDNYMLGNRAEKRLKMPAHLNQLVAAPAEAIADTADFEGARSARRLLSQRVRKLRSDDHELGLAAGEEVTEYLVRWCGLGQFANSWIAETRLREYASAMVDEYLLEAQDPPDKVSTLLPDIPQPAVRPGALRRSHFRRTAEATGPAATPDTVSIPPPIDPPLSVSDTSNDDAAQAAQAALIIYPDQTRIEVLYSGFEAKWWPGTVTRSRVSGTSSPFPILYVVFDDPRYASKEHVVRLWKADVRKLASSTSETL